MLVVLLRADEGDVPLGSLAITRLAHLGVTSVALLRDQQTICIVLEGWALDPAGSSHDVISALSATGRSAQPLQPSMHVSVEAVNQTRRGESSPLRGKDWEA
jgi:hypothetical protein